MCLLLIARRVDRAHPLVIAANRDEYHARPAEPLHWWPDRPGIAGGRDARAGGSWLAARSDGRFAAVLNDARVPAPPGAPSRGALVPACLEAPDAAAFTERLHGDAAAYAGFHFVAGADDCAWYLASRGQPPRVLAAGIHGVDNTGLDAAGPRLDRARALVEPLLRAAADPAALLAALGDTAPPAGGDGDARPVFIAGDAFGTRCSTVLVLSADGAARMVERRFGAAGEPSGETTLEWQWAPAGARRPR